MNQETLALPAYLNSFRPRKDKSVGLSFETQEINDEDIKKRLWELQGAFGSLLFVPLGAEITEAPPIPVEDKKSQPRTPSQILRGKIFRLWEILYDAETLEFEQFYRMKMGMLTDQINEEIAVRI